MSPASGNAAVGFNAAVTEERPDAAVVFQGLQVDVGIEDGFFGDGSLGNDLPVEVRDESLSPEFAVAFGSDAVDGADIASVGDGVAALDGFPGAVLCFAEQGFFFGEPADGGGVEEDLGPFQSRQPGCFRVPLVPADQDTYCSEFRFECLVAQVAGREVEFFFESGVLRDVHFAVRAEEGTVCVDNPGGVVVETGGAFFKAGSDDYDAKLGGKALVGFCQRTRERVCKVEELAVFRPAEVLGREEFLSTNDLCSVSGGLTDGILGASFVDGG